MTRSYRYSRSRIRTNTRNTDTGFENRINAVNDFYFARGSGLIQKQYNPFIQLSDRAGKVVDVKVAEKAIANYADIYERYAVAFEAKSSYTALLYRSRFD